MIPLPGSRLVDGATAARREAILSGEIAAGDQLSVPALSARLGISRSPVREAVLALAANGLAVERPRRGVVAVAFGPADADAVHEVRGPLEGLAARLGAGRITPGALTALRGILDAQAAAVAMCDEAATFDGNARFHAAIAAAAGNPELPRLLGALEGRMALALRRAANQPGHRTAAMSEHEALFEALAAHDADAAEAAMRHHLAATRARLAAGQVTPAG